MGIYIPNMEKPKDCKECQWHLDFYIEDKQVGGLCAITEKDDRENTCPLIEIDLIRCKDCKHYDTESRTFPCCTDIFGAVRYMEADGFCSKGERRTDEHTD